MAVGSVGCFARQISLREAHAKVFQWTDAPTCLLFIVLHFLRRLRIQFSIMAQCTPAAATSINEGLLGTFVQAPATDAVMQAARQFPCGAKPWVMYAFILQQPLNVHMAAMRSWGWYLNFDGQLAASCVLVLAMMLAPNWYQHRGRDLVVAAVRVGRKLAVAGFLCWAAAQGEQGLAALGTFHGMLMQSRGKLAFYHATYMINQVWHETATN